MQKRLTSAATALLQSAVIALLSSPAFAADAYWGIQAEQLEYRLGENSDDILAWDFDAFYGTDELKFVWRSEAEYEEEESRFESLENQFRLQVPVSDFFDAVGGVRLDTPKGVDRVSGVVGLHGLTRQWFEVDLDLFVSEHPSARFEVEYEGLITNYVTLTPSLEVDLPFTDDDDFEVGAWGPKAEIGARLSYDLVDRAVSPYLGVHYEHLFGETADIAEADGKDDNSVFAVIGVRIMY